MKLIFTMLIALLVISCSTLENPLQFDEAPLYGMIYDYQNRPVKSVQIMEGIIILGESDINGRFYLNQMRKGEHDLRFIREGYEEINISVDFQSRTEILYVKIRSAFDCLAEANILINQEAYSEAGELIDLGLSIEENNKPLLFLQAILYYKAQSFRKSFLNIEGLIFSGNRNREMYALLKDIYDAEPGFQIRITDLVRKYPPHPAHREFIREFMDIAEIAEKEDRQ